MVPTTGVRVPSVTPYKKHLFKHSCMRVPNWLLVVLTFLGCASHFVDTTTPGGVPNLVQFAPKMWRMGQPPTEAAWKELAARIAPNGEKVVVVKLDDEVEGSDNFAEAGLGWEVVRVPLPPEDDKPWTVFELPRTSDANLAVGTILAAHQAGKVVAWHCVHGRDRTGFISALTGRRLFGWSKKYAWQNMLDHGFRWELPDLDAYWVEDVQK